MPAETDLKISARAGHPGQGVLERLEARLEDGSQLRMQIEDKDTSPFHVDKLAASVSWDETWQRLALADILFKGGDTELKLAGELTTAADRPGWRLAVAGTDAVISGAAAADPWRQGQSRRSRHQQRRAPPRFRPVVAAGRGCSVA